MFVCLGNLLSDTICYDEALYMISTKRKCLHKWHIELPSDYFLVIKNDDLINPLSLYIILPCLFMSYDKDNKRKQKW